MTTCKHCRHINTEPFETQCDGVTPVVVPPDRGVCMAELEYGTVALTHSCPSFDPRPSPLAPLVSVCMICHHTIGSDMLPASPFLPAGSVVSHGICLTCLPGYAASQGLSQSEISRIIASTKINTPIHGGAFANQKPETVSTVSHQSH